MTDFFFQRRPQGARVDGPAFEGWLDALARFAYPGVYTPTLTNTTNLSASTASEQPYVRIGDVVIVGISFSADTVAGAPTATELNMSLPIPSTFTAVGDAAGTVAASIIQQSGRVRADVSGARFSILWDASDTSNRAWSGIAMYRIK